MRRMRKKYLLWLYCQGLSGLLRVLILSKLNRGQLNGLRKEGFRVAVFNPRGAFVPIKSSNVFDYSKNVNDLDFALNHIEKKYKDADIYFVGYSIGASYGIQYLSRMNENKRVKGMVGVGNPFDVADTMKSVDGFWTKLYSYSITKSLIQKVRFNLDTVNKIKETNKIEFDFDKLEKSMSIEEFDNEFTNKFYGIGDRTEYYSKLSSHEDIKNVTVPLMLINSKNDPISK